MPKTTFFVDPIDPDKESDIEYDADQLRALCEPVAHAEVVKVHIEGDYDAGSISGYIVLQADGPEATAALRKALQDKHWSFS